MLPEPLLRLYCENPPDETLAPFLNQTTFVTAEIDDAEFILHPLLVRNGKAELAQISRKYAKYPKKVLVFILADFERKYPKYRNLVVFRTSLRASKRRDYEFVLPYFWECRTESFSPLSTGSKPRVGFCGQLNSQRTKICAAFEQSGAIETTFVKRDQFWGGKPHSPDLISDFYRNLEQNHFTIAHRGAGNFSMRFYQALAVGRIPVLVDSDTILPFEKEIRWKDYIVFEKNAQSCVRRVREIHKAGEIEKLQQHCHALSRTWLAPERFLSNMAAELREKFL